MQQAQEVPLPHPEVILENLLTSSGHKFLLREIFDQSLEALAREGWQLIHRKHHPVASLLSRENALVREAIVDKKFEVRDAPLIGHGFRDLNGYRIDANAEVEFGEGEKLPVAVTYFFRDSDKFLGPDSLLDLRQGDTMDIQGRARIKLAQYFQTLIGFGIYRVGGTGNHLFGYEIREIVSRMVEKTREAFKIALGELPRPLSREFLWEHSFDYDLWHDGAKTSSVTIFNGAGHLIKLRREGDQTHHLNAGYVPFAQVSNGNGKPYVQLCGSQGK